MFKRALLFLVLCSAAAYAEGGPTLGGAAPGISSIDSDKDGTIDASNLPNVENQNTALGPNQVFRGSLSGTPSAGVVGNWSESASDPNSNESCDTLLDVHQQDTDGTDGTGDEILWYCAKVGDSSTAVWLPIAGFGIGADPPSVCTPPSIWIDTDTSTDTNCITTNNNSLCLCTSSNTWTALENN